MHPALSIARIIPCALAVVAIVLSFMPWFSISPTVVQASSYASQGANFLSQLAGQNTDYSSSLGFDENYNVWSLGKAGEVAVTYQSMYDSASDLASSLSSSYYDDYSDSGHGHAVSITNPNYGKVSSGGVSFISMAVTAFWALGMSPRSPVSCSTSPRASRSCFPLAVVSWCSRCWPLSCCTPT